MAFKIFWSPEALGDLLALTSYIAQDNPDAAERVGLAILHKVSLLEQHPFIGRKVPETNDPKIRELIERPFRIIYRVRRRERAAEVLRVWHGARGEPEIE
ncbi:MAG: type II toxin-antitoxin system RelE/ParE family toxin [Verrucomicrobia bacterium]|nr:MAG: type II toxin-antitoxin system RelE/ParE family toxin [Verrucomicrobiota bacterium]PYK01878.1 MAG: type II toxin-antitoxin system RelE/ParE family toxin [Verrucomicrobiota bacterium]